MEVSFLKSHTHTLTHTRFTFIFMFLIGSIYLIYCQSVLQPKHQDREICECCTTPVNQSQQRTFQHVDIKSLFMILRTVFVRNCSEAVYSHSREATKKQQRLTIVGKVSELSRCFLKWQRSSFRLNLLRFKQNMAHLELFKHVYCRDQMRCFNQEANGSKSRTPLVAEQKNISRRVSNNIKTISRLDFLSGTQTPLENENLGCIWDRTVGWGLSKARDTALKNESVDLKFIHEHKVSGGLKKAMKSRWCIRYLSTSAAKATHKCMTLHVQSSYAFRWSLKGHLVKNCFTSSRSDSHPPQPEHLSPLLTLTCLHRIDLFTLVYFIC